MNLALVMNDERQAGREEGIEICEKIGREQGIIQTAKTALLLGLEIQQVVEITGLAQEKVAELKSKV